MSRFSENLRKSLKSRILATFENCEIFSTYYFSYVWSYKAALGVAISFYFTQTKSLKQENESDIRFNDDEQYAYGILNFHRARISHDDKVIKKILVLQSNVANNEIPY